MSSTAEQPEPPYRLPDGSIVWDFPVALPDGTLGDGVVTLHPDDEGWAEADAELAAIEALD